MDRGGMAEKEEEIGRKRREEMRSWRRDGQGR